MPKGTGIYEDEPREHRHAYTPQPAEGGDDKSSPEENVSHDTPEPPD